MTIDSDHVMEELEGPISKVRLCSAMIDRHGHTYFAMNILPWLHDHPTAPLANLSCLVNDLTLDLTTQKILQHLEADRESVNHASVGLTS